jgi:hypothetical protein
MIGGAMILQVTFAVYIDAVRIYLHLMLHCYTYLFINLPHSPQLPRPHSWPRPSQRPIQR